MSKQSRLTNFFTAKARQSAILPIEKENTTLRALSTNIEDEIAGGMPAKRQKIELTEQIVQLQKFPQLTNYIGASWLHCLRSEIEKDYFEKLQNFVKNERAKKTVYPPENQVFTWTQRCRIEDVRVVIIGQDPYHGPGQAHGLCFSVRKGVTPPPSLKNIFKELESDIPGFKKPDHGDLTGWAEQGVLLLNACLTVRAGEPNSHANNGWERLTDAVIKWISDNLEGVVFLLWGAYAEKKAAMVDKNKHHLLRAPHPSPLSASRGFFGCKHFSKCNKILEENGKKPIDWSYLPSS